MQPYVAANQLVLRSLASAPSCSQTKNLEWQEIYSEAGTGRSAPPAHPATCHLVAGLQNDLGR